MADISSVIERANQAYNKKDLDSFIGNFAKNAELTWPSGKGEPMSAQGQDEIRDFWQAGFEAFPDGKVPNGEPGYERLDRAARAHLAGH